jgi:hypothetical protein
MGGEEERKTDNMQGKVQEERKYTKWKRGRDKEVRRISINSARQLSRYSDYGAV